MKCVSFQHTPDTTCPGLFACCNGLMNWSGQLLVNGDFCFSCLVTVDKRYNERFNPRALEVIDFHDYQSHMPFGVGAGPEPVYWSLEGAFDPQTPVGVLFSNLKQLLFPWGIAPEVLQKLKLPPGLEILWIRQPAASADGEETPLPPLDPGALLAVLRTAPASLREIVVEGSFNAPLVIPDDLQLPNVRSILIMCPAGQLDEEALRRACSHPEASVELSNPDINVIWTAITELSYQDFRDFAQGNFGRFLTQQADGLCFTFSHEGVSDDTYAWMADRLEDANLHATVLNVDVLCLPNEGSALPLFEALHALRGEVLVCGGQITYFRRVQSGSLPSATSPAA